MSENSENKRHEISEQAKQRIRAALQPFVVRFLEAATEESKQEVKQQAIEVALRMARDIDPEVGVGDLNNQWRALYMNSTRTKVGRPRSPELSRLDQSQVRPSEKIPTQSSVGSKRALSEGELDASAVEVFEEGGDALDVVKKLKLPFGDAEERFQKYSTLKGGVYFTRKHWEEICRPLNEVTYFNQGIRDLDGLIRRLVQDHLELQKFEYKCSRCGGRLQAQANLEWKYIIERGLLKWGHSTCIDAGKN
jgi:hypothetical protein